MAVVWRLLKAEVETRVCQVNLLNDSSSNFEVVLYLGILFNIILLYMYTQLQVRRQKEIFY